MTPRKHLSLIATGIALAGLLSTGPAAARDVPRKLDRALALETFDRAWELVDSSPYDVRGKGVDWDAVRERHRPDAARARDMPELRRSISAMLGEIGESHFGLIPASVAEFTHDADDDDHEAPTGNGFADTGLDVRMVEDQLAVVHVRESSPAATAGIAAGWVITTIGGRPISEAVDEIGLLETPAARRRALVELESALRSRLGPDKGQRAVQLGLRDTQGKAHELRLQPGPARGEPVNIPLLPPMLFNLSQQRLPTDDGGCIGLVSFDLWVPQLARAFPEALEQVRDCHGLVIDLRGNPGGVIGTAMGLGGWLVAEATPLGHMNAAGSSARLTSLPRKVSDDGRPVTPYAAPLAILIDRGSASTSEVFTSGLQASGRAHVLGENSAGMALPSLIHPLPNGDRLLYAVADLTAPDGSRLEGQGITPDTPAAPTLAALAGGQDLALDAARRWILSSTTATTKETTP